jgi:2-polyprenyl-3-methyl-5-hydroxy-6-metoxy-1,4-benzoquinol methylase
MLCVIFLLKEKRVVILFEAYWSGMLELEQKKQADENAIMNVNYRQVSIFDEHLKEESFDVIIAFNVLHYMSDMPDLMRRSNS